MVAALCNSKLLQSARGWAAAFNFIEKGKALPT
jgi:hypothetical protein